MPETAQGTYNVAEALHPLLVSIDDLHADPSNVRRHGRKNLDAIKASFEQFGQRKPVVVRKEGMVVVAGNGTLEAVAELEWTHLAAVVIDEDEITAMRFALADNRTAELATWDYEALGVSLDKLGDKQTAPLLMARLKRQPAAPVASNICRALARIVPKITTPEASWVHRRVKADTNFKARHYADLLCVILEKACKGAPAKFNALVADAKGLDALKAYVEKAGASKNAPLAKWAAGKFNLLKIVKKP